MAENRSLAVGEGELVRRVAYLNHHRRLLKLRFVNGRKMSRKQQQKKTAPYPLLMSRLKVKKLAVVSKLVAAMRRIYALLKKPIISNYSTFIFLRLSSLTKPKRTGPRFLQSPIALFDS